MSGQAEAELKATAACGAYMLVAFADARYDRVEEERFLGGVVNDPVFAALPSDLIAETYNNLHARLSDDYDGAQAAILSAIRACRDDKTVIAAIKLAARQAVIADHEVKPQEEVALGHIAGALGVIAEEL